MQALIQTGKIVYIVSTCIRWLIMSPQLFSCPTRRCLVPTASSSSSARGVYGRASQLICGVMSWDCRSLRMRCKGFRIGRFVSAAYESCDILLTWIVSDCGCVYNWHRHVLVWDAQLDAAQWLYVVNKRASQPCPSMYSLAPYRKRQPIASSSRVWRYSLLRSSKTMRWEDPATRLIFLSHA
jgi:hypothetical protein